MRFLFFSASFSTCSFDDCDDGSSHEFSEFNLLRNHCSLIFIGAIIDSRGLTKTALIFSLSLYVVQINQPCGEWRQMSVPKNGFLDMKEAAGLPFP